MRDIERLSFLWQENIPMTANEIAAITNRHRGSIYRDLAGVLPAREKPRRWFPRHVERVIFRGEEVAPDG